MAVAIEQPLALKPPMRSPRRRLLSYTNFDYFMLEPSQIDIVHSLGQAVQVSSFPRSVSTPCLTLNPKTEEISISSPGIEIIGGRGAPKVRALVAEVAIAVAFGADSVPVSSGLGGAYFLCGRNGNSIAVAKPIDEEPFALNNPKGFTGRMFGQPGLKRSVRLGETGMRELAAYLLDHGGFAGVPPTALVKISHVEFNVNSSASVASPPYRIASLQRFVDHECDAGELGPSSFSVSSVHRIGILDVRLLNIDRHSGNILVKKHEREGCSVGEAELVPIDHGLCLPEWLDDPYFEWLHWPQAAVPFSDSELEYIAKLNPYEDAKLLRIELPCLSESSVRVLVVCSIFLKEAAAAGLSLADIGEMLTRECYGGEETISILENVCAKAKDRVSTMTIDDDYSSVIEEKSEEDFGVFQLDDECADSLLSLLNILERPHASQNHPAFINFPPPRSNSGFPGLMLTTLFEDEYRGHTPDAHNEKNRNNNHKAGCLTKRFSFTVPSHKNEAVGVSLGDMNDEEWKLFLEAFKKLLLKVIETRKSISSIRRLGTSCRF
ncbi:hypothetical protein Droror1_Dr00009727 [Drosera rotundifolia]